jgi:hypothetical protein
MHEYTMYPRLAPWKNCRNKFQCEGTCTTLAYVNAPRRNQREKEKWSRNSHCWRISSKVKQSFTLMEGLTRQLQGRELKAERWLYWRLGKRDAEETCELRCQELKLFSQTICQQRFNLKIHSFRLLYFLPENLEHSLHELGNKILWSRY